MKKLNNQIFIFPITLSMKRKNLILIILIFIVAFPQLKAAENAAKDLKRISGEVVKIIKIAFMSGIDARIDIEKNYALRELYKDDSNKWKVTFSYKYKMLDDGRLGIILDTEIFFKLSGPDYKKVRILPSFASDRLKHIHRPPLSKYVKDKNDKELKRTTIKILQLIVFAYNHIIDENREPAFLYELEEISDRSIFSKHADFDTRFWYVSFVDRNDNTKKKVVWIKLYKGRPIISETPDKINIIVK